ncbi:MAG: AAA family ATPase [Candidatus Altiarchaeota archaeon]|nr:AAA family ATPase [Candidatus Altiarchaeota archaeon]
MEKIKTGVPGLDEMLYGGIIKGRPYLVAGGPGTGKTTLCVQFLMEGLKNNEKALYLSLEEQADELKEDMALFGWNLDKIRVIDTSQDLSTGVWSLRTVGLISKPEFNLKNLVNVIKEKIEDYGPQRVIIDSLTSVKMLYDDRMTARKEILGFMNVLSRLGCTTILTSESSGPDTLMEEFLACGVIKLFVIEEKGERLNALLIQKMRGSKFDNHIRPVKITDKGMIVYATESVFK